MTPPVVRAAPADDDLRAPIERAADQRNRALGRPESADGDGIPLDDWHPSDLPQRLAWWPTTSGSSGARRAELIECLDDTIARGGELVLRRLATGDPAFIEMFESRAGSERFDRRRSWWAEHRHVVAAALA